MVTVVPASAARSARLSSRSDRQRLVEGQPELGQLDRDVGVQGFGMNPNQPFDVLVSGADRRGTIVALLPEKIEGHEKTVLVEPAGSRHTLIQGVARDESPSEGLAWPGAGDRPLHGPGLGEGHDHPGEDTQPCCPSSAARFAAAWTASSTRARNPRSSSTCTAAAVVPPGEVTCERSSAGVVSVSVRR